ncbi:hypothetical protein EYR27_05670 [Xanthomonas oryzae]|nr:hypothetical protein EYR27_05670 [Xanthomonas oryzae]
MTASGLNAGRKTAHAGPGGTPSRSEYMTCVVPRPHLELRVCRRAAPRSCATFPEGTSHPAANHCFPLYRE